MKIEFQREKTVFYFKALLCIFSIALWSFWFTNSSKESKYKKTTKHPEYTNNENIKRFQIKKAEELFQEDEKEIKKIVHQNSEIITKSKESIPASKISVSKTSKERSNLQNNLLKELPKLATLTPAKTNVEKTKTESIIPKEMINVNLPNIASATRKALLKNNSESKQEAEHNLPLRKGIPVEKNRLKPVSIKSNLDEGWLPKDALENLDKLAEQIELAGIVNKPNGESTAIIRNKSNNYIEILKKGDEYKGLKLLEISKNEVILGNQALNKMYAKKINIGN